MVISFGSFCKHYFLAKEKKIINKQFEQQIPKNKRKELREIRRDFGAADWTKK